MAIEPGVKDTLSKVGQHFASSFATDLPDSETLCLTQSYIPSRKEFYVVVAVWGKGSLHPHRAPTDNEFYDAAVRFGYDPRNEVVAGTFLSRAIIQTQTLSGLN